MEAGRHELYFLHLIGEERQVEEWRQGGEEDEKGRVLVPATSAGDGKVAVTRGACHQCITRHAQPLWSSG